MSTPHTPRAMIGALKTRSSSPRSVVWGPPLDGPAVLMWGPLSGGPAALAAHPGAAKSRRTRTAARALLEIIQRLDDGVERGCGDLCGARIAGALCVCVGATAPERYAIFFFAVVELDDDGDVGLLQTRLRRRLDVGI